MSVVPPEVEEQIVSAFKLFDCSGRGYVRFSEVLVALKALKLDMDASELEYVLGEIQRANHNNSGNDGDKIRLPTFMDIATLRYQQRDPIADAEESFELFDHDADGFISLDDLRQISLGLGESVSDGELKQMIAQADKDCDGLVSKQEFIRLIAKAKMY